MASRRKGSSILATIDSRDPISWLCQLVERKIIDTLRMRYVENLPSKEIAERMDKSDAAIRVMLTRSIKKLQYLLGAE